MAAMAVIEEEGDRCRKEEDAGPEHEIKLELPGGPVGGRSQEQLPDGLGSLEGVFLHRHGLGQLPHFGFDQGHLGAVAPELDEADAGHEKREEKSRDDFLEAELFPGRFRRNEKLRSRVLPHIGGKRGCDHAEHLLPFERGSDDDIFRNISNAARAEIVTTCPESACEPPFYFRRGRRCKSFRHCSGRNGTFRSM